MREVKAQPVGGHQRPLLLHVRTQNLPQCGMQQVGCGVIERSRAAARSVHVSTEHVPHGDRPFGDPPDMRVRCAALLSVFYNEPHSTPCELASVADLATRFRVEGCAIENDLALLACDQPVNECARFEKRDDVALRLETVISLEQGARIDCRTAAKIDTELAGFLRAPALFVHRRIESRLIDFESTLAGNVGSQVGRKSVGVVQFEDDFPRNASTRGQG